MSDAPAKPGGAAISPAAVIDHLQDENKWLRARCLALGHTLAETRGERDALRAELDEVTARIDALNARIEAATAAERDRLAQQVEDIAEERDELAEQPNG